MAYKEPHFDSEGAKALYEALSQMNDNVTKEPQKESEDEVNPTKKPLRKKRNNAGYKSTTESGNIMNEKEKN